MKTLHISAGGKGSRIHDYTSQISPDLPKHLLPIPTKGKTILGEIIRSAKPDFEKVIVWTSEQNNSQISSSIGVGYTSMDTELTGPLGPMIRHAIQTKQRTYGCAGDFFCRFSWAEFEGFHNSTGLPISILVSNSVPTSEGAIFNVDSDVVTSWERVLRTTEEDKINIGCYIVDPNSDVINALESLEKHKEDPFFDLFIARRLISGFTPGTPGFNINTSEVYKHLLDKLKQAQL